MLLGRVIGTVWATRKDPKVAGMKWLIVRALKTDKSPWGTLNPYLVAGVPILKTTVTPRTTAQFRNQDGDTDVSVGYKVGAGLAYQIAPNLMVFAEYRFIHSEASVELRDSALLKKTPVHLDFDTHAGILGLSARW